VIAAAADLLRESGPAALTSVNVAKRLGVTQSAIYRHVDDMDELAAVASQVVVGDLSAVLTEVVTSPATTWGDGNDLARFADQVVTITAQHDQAIATIDRWRHEPGVLGDGIRSILDDGGRLVAHLLEQSWRSDFACDEPFDEITTKIHDAHGRLAVDDMIVVVRAVPGSGPAAQHAIARTLAFRLFAGWCSYVLDMNTRMGLPIPELGASTMSPPEYSLS
jgi:AcrR family transcriptional regulator